MVTFAFFPFALPLLVLTVAATLPLVLPLVVLGAVAAILVARGAGSERPAGELAGSWPPGHATAYVAPPPAQPADYCHAGRKKALSDGPRPMSRYR